MKYYRMSISVYMIGLSYMTDFDLFQTVVHNRRPVLRKVMELPIGNGIPTMPIIQMRVQLFRLAIPHLRFHVGGSVLGLARDWYTLDALLARLVAAVVDADVGSTGVRGDWCLTRASEVGVTRCVVCTGTVG